MLLFIHDALRSTNVSYVICLSDEEVVPRRRSPGARFQKGAQTSDVTDVAAIRCRSKVRRIFLDASAIRRRARLPVFQLLTNTVRINRRVERLMDALSWKHVLRRPRATSPFEFQDEPRRARALLFHISAVFSLLLHLRLVRCAGENAETVDQIVSRYNSVD